MAQLSMRTFNELIGRTDLLDTRAGIEHWKAKGLDFSRVFHRVDPGALQYQTEEQDHGLDQALDHQLIERCRAVIESEEKISFITPVRKRNRTVGAMLWGQIALCSGNEGLPDDTLNNHYKGTAGQSVGDF